MGELNDLLSCNMGSHICYQTGSLLMQLLNLDIFLKRELICPSILDHFFHSLKESLSMKIMIIFILVWFSFKYDAGPQMIYSILSFIPEKWTILVTSLKSIYQFFHLHDFKVVSMYGYLEGIHKWLFSGNCPNLYRLT